jgi:hypothetical protein
MTLRGGHIARRTENVKMKKPNLAESDFPAYCFSQDFQTAKIPIGIIPTVPTSFTAPPEVHNRGRNHGEFQDHTGDSPFACSNLSLLASSFSPPAIVNSTHFRPRLRRRSRARLRVPREGCWTPKPADSLAPKEIGNP